MQLDFKKNVSVIIVRRCKSVLAWTFSGEPFEKHGKMVRNFIVARVYRPAMCSGDHFDNVGVGPIGTVRGHSSVT